MSFLRARAVATLPSFRAGLCQPALKFSTTAPNHLATADEPTTSASIPPPSFIRDGAKARLAYSTPSAGVTTMTAGAQDEAFATRTEQKRTEPRRIRMNYTVPRGIALPPASDPLLSYFTNIMMRQGKRHQAARQVAEMLNSIHVLTHSPPLPILREAVERVSPEVKVVSQKQRNKNIMTPRPLSAKQRTGQAIRWILTISQKRHERILEHRLAKEIVAIINDSSEVLKKKDEVHKLALANRCVYDLLFWMEHPSLNHFCSVPMLL